VVKVFLVLACPGCGELNVHLWYTDLAEYPSIQRRNAMSAQSTQEAVAEIWALFRETDARFKETAARQRKTDDQLRRLEGLFGNQWGKMLEALVEPSALNLFRSRGIDVHHIYTRAKVKRNGENREFDILLEDTTDLVVVEVKSTLRVEDVNDFLDDLDQFPHYFPRYDGYAIYGAVAGLDIVEEADRYAYKRGLYVLRVSGEGLVTIGNDSSFTPKIFGNPTA